MSVLQERTKYPHPYLPIPEVVTTAYPFVTIGDLSVVAGRIDPRLRSHPSIQKRQLELLERQRDAAPSGSTFYYIEHGQMVAGVERLAMEKLGEGGSQKWGIVNLDRYIFAEKKGADIFSLDVSRGADNKLVSRPGSSRPVEIQLADMSSWLRKGEFDGLVLVDDVVAFATTFPPIIELLRSVRPLNIAVCAGICSSGGQWSGLEKLKKLDAAVSALTIVHASEAVDGATSGMAIPDSRDSTFFGGKIGVAASGRQFSFPYFFPFSTPTSSLMAREKKIAASEGWLDFNVALLRDIELAMGRPLTIGDLERHGFGVPMTSIPELKDDFPEPDERTPLAEHLSFAMGLFQENRPLFEQLINPDVNKK